MARWFRNGLSVSAPFVWRCLNSLSVLRFHIPLIEPDVRISRIRLSDGRRLQAHTARSSQAASPEGQACSRIAWSFMEVIGLRHSPDPCSFPKRVRSQAPFLPRHYPASQVLRACPPPHSARPIPRGVPVGGSRSTTAGASRVAWLLLFHTCRRHYPGGTLEPVAGLDRRLGHSLFICPSLHPSTVGLFGTCFSSS